MILIAGIPNACDGSLARSPYHITRALQTNKLGVHKVIACSAIDDCMLCKDHGQSGSRARFLRDRAQQSIVEPLEQNAVNLNASLKVLLAINVDMRPIAMWVSAGKESGLYRPPRVQYGRCRSEVVTCYSEDLFGCT